MGDFCGSRTDNYAIDPNYEAAGPYDKHSLMHYPTIVIRNGKQEQWMERDESFHDWEQEKKSAWFFEVRADGSEHPIPLNI